MSVDAAVYERDELEVVEVVRGEEVRIRPVWVDPTRSEAPLYPEGLDA